MEIPTLTTERLILRPPTLADAPAIQNQFGVWEIIKWQRPPMVPWPYPADGAQHFFEHILLPAVAAGKKLAFMLEHKADQAVIGSIEYRPEPTPGHFRRGLWLALPYHRQGYMSEAGQASIQWLFTDHGGQQLFSCNAVGNTASQKLSRREGFTLQEVRPAQPIFHSGDIQEEDWLLTKEAFLARHANH